MAEERADEERTLALMSVEGSGSDKVEVGETFEGDMVLSCISFQVDVVGYDEIHDVTHAKGDYVISASFKGQFVYFL